MNDTDFPIANLVMIGCVAVLLCFAAISIFRTSTDSTHPIAGVRPSAGVQVSETPSGVGALLYLVGVLALLLSGFSYALAETSLHQILATLIGLGGAIFFAAGAVVTELQRIKRRLEADAAIRRSNQS